MFIALILSVVLLWFLQEFLFNKFWDKKLTVELKFSESYIYEGDESVLKEVVKNDKRFPIPAVDVRLAVGRAIKFVNDAKENSAISDKTYKRDVFSFIGRQQITRKLHFVAEKRGLYEIKEADATVYDFFFIGQGILSYAQDTRIFVYPSVVSTERINLICQDISGMIISQNKLNPDPFEFYGIREYVNTDPMNHINWKASVRTGDLMVNQFDSTTNVNLQILLDLEDPYIIKYDDLVEECIRIVASLSGRLVSKNMPLTVKSNGIDYENGEMIDMYMPAGGGKIMELNQKLACVDTANIKMSAVGLLENVSQSVTDRITYIFVSKNRSEELIQAVAALAKKSANILWVMPEYENAEADEIRLPGVKVLRWEVSS